MPGHPLIRLMLAHAQGREAVPHRPVPPTHLCEQRWRFSCACGCVFHHTGDAVWRDEDWRPPRKQCLVCLAWNDGRVIHA